MGVLDRVRRSSSTVLGAYGRAVLGVADMLGATTPAELDQPARQVIAPLPEPLVDGATTDLGALRAQALASVLAAAVDPSRPAADRFATRVSGISDWSAGRLLADAERMRDAGISVARSIASTGGVVHQRHFATALRQQFPWLDDASAYRLWDHAVLMVRRSGATVSTAADPGVDAPRSGLGGLLGRLRRRA